MTEWQSARLGDLCKIDIGKTPSRGVSRYWDKGRETDNVWLSIADLTQSQGGQIYDSKEYVSDEAARSLKPVKAGTLLMSFKLSIGKMAVAGRDLFTNEAIAALTIIDSKSMSREYLQYFLSGYDWEAATAGDHKVKGKTLNKAKLKELNISFPPPTEQQRIVGILDQAFEGIAKAKANAERNLANAKELFESQLEEVFSLQDASWHNATLSEVCKKFGRGKSRHRPRNDPSLYGGDYPFIQTGDVRNSGDWITAYSQTYNEKGLAQSLLWPRGTLCITIAANIAEIGILDFDACFPDSIIGCVVNEEITSNEYLCYVLRYYQAHLKAQGKGSAQDNINLATFENQKFPFPSMAVQDEIVEKLNSIWSSIEAYEANRQSAISGIADLRQSILHQAFSGKL